MEKPQYKGSCPHHFNRSLSTTPISIARCMLASEMSAPIITAGQQELYANKPVFT